ncbi:MAG: DUF2510 domain-containing protein [Rhodoglobus sp.]
MDDNQFGVPAGWYPDPLGLPQLRWWDAQAWSEHTSEARAPIVIQPAARLAFADYDERPVYEERPVYDERPVFEERPMFDERPMGDSDELPSRRDLRNRERSDDTGAIDYASFLVTETDEQHEELSAQPLLAMTLRELEPPLSDDWDGASSEPRSASSHANAMPAASTLSAMAEEVAPERVIKRMRTYTFASWAIAVMPALQLSTMLVLLVVFKLGSNFPLVIALAVLANLAVLGFAFYDRLLLMTWGHRKPASALWALLREPGYLFARAFRTFGETGRGFAPLAFWGSTLALVFAAVIAFPGLVIAVAPGVFQGEAEHSVQSDAAVLGAKIDVTCPAPPTLIGDRFTCIRTSSDGSTDSIVVSLQRENGWISWRVEDWGNSVMSQHLGS